MSIVEKTICVFQHPFAVYMGLVVVVEASIIKDRILCNVLQYKEYPGLKQVRSNM